MSGSFNISNIQKENNSVTYTITLPTAAERAAEVQKVLDETNRLADSFGVAVSNSGVGRKLFLKCGLPEDMNRDSETRFRTNMYSIINDLKWEDKFTFDFIPSRVNPLIVISYKDGDTYEYPITPGAIQSLSQDHSNIMRIQDYGKRNKNLAGLVRYIKKIVGDKYKKISSLKFSKEYTKEEIERIKESGDIGERRHLAHDLYYNKDSDTLKTMINDSDKSVRFWVAWGLYENRDYDTLKTMVNDRYDSVRDYVGLGLVDAEDWNTLQEFLDKEESNWVKDDVEQYIANKILEKHFGSLKFSKEYTKEEIEKIKESGDDEERRVLALILYENKDYDTLKTMINDSNRDVRYWVAKGLYDNKDYDTLKTMINDSNGDVRSYVAEGLYYNKDYDTLKTMIDDSSDLVRYWVAAGLYKNKDYDTLKTMTNDSDEVVRYYVGYSLVDTEDWNTLQEFLEKEENRWVKSSVEQYVADKILEKHFGSKGERMNKSSKIKINSSFSLPQRDLFLRSLGFTKVGADTFMDKDYGSIWKIQEDEDQKYLVVFTNDEGDIVRQAARLSNIRKGVMSNVDEVEEPEDKEEGVEKGVGTPDVEDIAYEIAPDWLTYPYAGSGTTVTFEVNYTSGKNYVDVGIEDDHFFVRKSDARESEAWEWEFDEMVKGWNEQAKNKKIASKKTASNEKQIAQNTYNEKVLTFLDYPWQEDIEIEIVELLNEYRDDIENGLDYVVKDYIERVVKENKLLEGSILNSVSEKFADELSGLISNKKEAKNKKIASKTAQEEKKDSDKELEMGRKVEMEHKDTIEKFKKEDVDTKDVAEGIAKDHLKEISDYYTKLKEMEKKATRLSKTAQAYSSKVILKALDELREKYSRAGAASLEGIISSLRVHLEIAEAEENERWQGVVEKINLREDEGEEEPKLGSWTPLWNDPHLRHFSFKEKKNV